MRVSTKAVNKMIWQFFCFSSCFDPTVRVYQLRSKLQMAFEGVSEMSLELNQQGNHHNYVHSEKAES